MKKNLFAFLLTLSLLLFNSFTSKANWWDDLKKAVSSLWQPVWGKYEEDGSTTAVPLTTFSRKSDVYWNQRETIRTNLKLSDDKYYYFQIYKEIYENARDGDITGDIFSTDGQGVCIAAKLAKDAAFVYLMGFDETGLDLDSTGGAGRHDRQAFYDKAVYLLDKCWVYNVGDAFGGSDNQMYRAYELIEYLQAHDYLTTARAVGLTYTDYDYENSRNQLEEFTYDLYGRANNLYASLDEYNNQTLIVSGAIGMAAVSLSDKTTYWWKFQQKPSRWANAAHAYINRSLWTGPGFFNERFCPGPMSDKQGIAGYAEGPHYFEISAQSLIPFFKSFNNFVNKDMTGKYYTSMLNFSPETVRNYVYDDNYDKLYQWYTRIQMPNGEMPSYDDTYTNYASGIFAVTGNGDYSRATDYNKLKLVGGGAGNYSFREDYLAAFNYPTTPVDKNAFLFAAAGDLVVRTPWDTPLSAAHYFHMNGENGTSLNGYRPILGDNYWGHEHGDAGSFIIGAGEDVLAIDPAMYGWGYRYDVDKGEHHNVITIDGDGPTPDQSSEMTFDPNTNVGTLETTYEGYLGNDYAKLKREVEISDKGYPLYYIIDDNVTNLRWRNIETMFNLNGNGLSSATVPSFHIDATHSNVAIWDHPCKKDNNKNDNWQMRATLLSQLNGYNAGNTWSTQNGSTHGTNQSNYSGFPADSFITTNEILGNITNYVFSGNDYKGEHTRATKTITLAPDEVAHYYVKIEILGCLDDTTKIAKYIQNPNHTVHTAISYSNEKYFNIHYSRTSGLIGYDTVINPLSIDSCTLALGTNARVAFYSFSPNLTFKSGTCESYTNFRKASIRGGDSLIYNDTTYISSNTSITAYNSIVGKYKYKGFVTAPSGGAIVKFCIPDLVNGIPMVALKGYGSALTSSYNDSANWKYITITFPAGTTNFSIQPANPCMFDCYFPPLGININDTTFNANDGDLHTLGHKLTILNHGLLHVTNGTRIDICDGVYLRNRDSLIIEGPCQTSNKGFDPCSGISGLYNTDPSSAIIISAGSALVLDSGSYTYLKSGGAIWVKQNGSLIIKNNAFVQIGDSGNRICSKGFGEIVTEPGANLYIEPNAHIEFARTAGDTVDRNLFYAKGASASVYPSMSTILTNDTILSPLDYPVAICALDTKNPVKHREWGYCDFMHPLAKYLVKSDTICPNEQMCIYLNRILNSAYTTINVCRIDSVQLDSTILYGKGGLFYMDTCYNDTFWRDSVIRNGDDSCLRLHTIPDNFCLHFKPNTLHRITINTINDCGVKDDTVGYVFVSDTPQFSIWIPDTVCPGSTITVDVTDINHQPGTYTFGIAEIPDSLSFSDIITNSADTILFGYYYESHTGYLPDSFTFSNFKVKGNRTYAVSLKVDNDCSSYSTYHLTKTTFGAKINITLASTYNNPVGPAAFQLHGIASGATSFSWSPTTYLTNYTTLDPVSTPSDSIRYVFTASNGTCTDKDTAYVRHNELAYAGIDTEVCYNQNILLGTDYTAAIFLGLVWHSADHSQYDNVYQTLQSGNKNFAKAFMHWMVLHLQQNYSGQPAIDNFTNNEDLRTALFKDPGFISYYNNFISNNGASTVFTDFDNIINGNGTLQNLVENTYQYMPGSNFLDFNNLFMDFTNWCNTNYDPLTIKWERLDGTNWTSLSSFNDYFNMEPDNTSDKSYRVTIINSSNSSVEYDQVMVKRDSIVSPLFEIAYQYDSTVIFHDISTPEQHMYRYSWNFGDGGYSTVKNPYHTFTHSDTSFIVCMTIRDSCGTYTKCDTLKIDSFNNIGLYGKTGQTKTTKRNDQTSNIQTINDNYLSVNRPNPFSDYSIAEYVLSDGNHDAEIRITSTIGSLIKTYKLTQNKGIIIIDGSQLRDGMYYYSLIIDGGVVASKVMVIQK